MSRLFARIAFLYTALAAVAGSAMAGVNPPASAPAAAVPALSEWSLLALVPLVGVLAYRAKKKTDRDSDKQRKDSDETDQ